MILSVLDLSIVSGRDAQAQALRDTLEAAKAAERLGYHRFWVSEHHNIPGVASPGPEVLIAALTQVTTTIRLGSGGVMLVNHSPLKVAEVFMALEALAPGRIDLGLGRALGTDPRTGAALRSAGSEAFPHYFALLCAWLLDAAGKEPIGPGHPLHDVHASPTGPSHPDVFLLCSSADSAILAGQAGVGMIYSEFIAQREGGEAAAAYRKAFRPSPFRETPWTGIAVAAIAAPTVEAAKRLDAPRRASQLATAMGRQRRFPSVEEAEDFLAGFRNDPRLAAVETRSIASDPATVRARLAAKAAAAEADEVFILATGPTLADRIRSLELIKAADG
ncbi:MsnO8 family LLM class oxidoreductase [Phenylobacterium sp.]|jgi:luciferase family oxidoreductase group 1|uniref:MsnO8 family LLM class oxidoreductase n=1 Tax=Phenylobacterium sp. TaxID=1871053 RepID=UPI002F4025E8